MVTPNLGETESLWMNETDMPGSLELREDATFDVCVVGGGLGGILSAYLLAQEGLSVCILEESRLGTGQTGRTTAHFTVALDDRYFELEKYHGQEGIRLAAESHQAALDKTIEIVERERIDCDLKLVDGYLFRAFSSPEDILAKELEACQRAGLNDVIMVSQGPYEFFKTGPCLMFPKQVQLHPLKYLKGLVQIIHLLGVKIYEQTTVESVEDGDIVKIKTRNGMTVSARHAIVATNSPINDRLAIHTKQAPYRTYAISAKIPKASVPAALCWDALDPYHYVRIIGESLDSTSRGVEEVPTVESTDELIVGGEDHKTGHGVHPEECWARLETWMRRRFPMAGEMTSRWSGQVMEPVDGLAFLGRNPGDHNVYVITGDSGNGMTHCTIGAMLISDLINGRKNRWEDLYNPSRVSFRAVPDFIKENASTVVHLARRLAPSDLKDFREISDGEGAVVHHRGQKLAIYKDEQGQYHCYSAVCPHMGCVVNWNSAEKSWDCPCHGSRFDCHGHVIEGPAVKDIPRTEWSL